MKNSLIMERSFSEIFTTITGWFQVWCESKISLRNLTIKSPLKNVCKFHFFDMFRNPILFPSWKSVLYYLFLRSLIRISIRKVHVFGFQSATETSRNFQLLGTNVSKSCWSYIFTRALATLDRKWDELTLVFFCHSWADKIQEPKLKAKLVKYIQR